MPGLAEKMPYDFAGIVIVVLFVVWYIYGSSQNSSMLTKIARGLRVALKTQFAVTGKDAADPGRGITYESDSSALMWCTGRKNVLGLAAQINLQPRQNLFHTIFASGLPARIGSMFGIPVSAFSGLLGGSTGPDSTPDYDHIVIEVPFAPSTAPAMVLTLAPPMSSKDVKAYVDARGDLKLLATELAKGSLKDASPALGSYTCWADAREVALAVFTQNMVSALPSLGGALKELHITDRPDLAVPLNSDNEPERSGNSFSRTLAAYSVQSDAVILKLVFAVPKGSNVDAQLASIVDQACSLVDHIARLHLSPTLLGRIVASRERLVKQREAKLQAERAAKYAEEKRKQEEEEEKQRLAKMTPAEQVSSCTLDVHSHRHQSPALHALTCNRRLHRVYAGKVHEEEGGEGTRGGQEEDG